MGYAVMTLRSGKYEGSSKDAAKAAKQGKDLNPVVVDENMLSTTASDDSSERRQNQYYQGKSTTESDEGSERNYEQVKQVSREVNAALAAVSGKGGSSAPQGAVVVKRAQQRAPPQAPPQIQQAVRAGGMQREQMERNLDVENARPPKRQSRSETSDNSSRRSSSRRGGEQGDQGQRRSKTEITVRYVEENQGTRRSSRDTNERRSSRYAEEEDPYEKARRAQRKARRDHASAVANKGKKRESGEEYRERVLRTLVAEDVDSSYEPSPKRDPGMKKMSAESKMRWGLSEDS